MWTAESYDKCKYHNQFQAAVRTTMTIALRYNKLNVTLCDCEQLMACLNHSETLSSQWHMAKSCGARFIYCLGSHADLYIGLSFGVGMPDLGVAIDRIPQARQRWDAAEQQHRRRKAARFRYMEG